MSLIKDYLSKSQVLTKSCILVNNKHASRFLRALPESTALNLMNAVQRNRRDKALKNHRETFSKSKQEGKIVFLFILWKPQLWNSQRTVFEAAKQNPNIETYVVVCPDKSRMSDGSFLNSVDYYREQCGEIIEAVQPDGSIFDISTLKPDIIIRQSPYDMVFPKEYSMSNLAKIAKTCYIPYNYNFTPNHLHIEYNDRLLADSYAIFSDCKTNYEHCLKQRDEWYPDLHPYYFGYPRFDIVRRMQTKNLKEVKSFTWAPRWNTDTVGNDGTTFFEYKDLLPDYFKAHPDLSLVIRPHPNMFNNFVGLGLMTENEVGAYLKKIDDIPNVRMDDNMDYLETFKGSDALIADVSAINYEFYLTGKPIIFCGDTSHHNAETKVMYELIYKAKNWGQLESEINKLANGIDPNKEARLNDVSKAFEGLPNDIGAAIVEQCIKIARGSN